MYLPVVVVVVVVFVIVVVDEVDGCDVVVDDARDEARDFPLNPKLKTVVKQGSGETMSPFMGPSSPNRSLGLFVLRAGVAAARVLPPTPPLLILPPDVALGFFAFLEELQQFGL